MREFTAAATAATILLVATPALMAQTIQDNLWVPNGSINALASSNGILYVGGSFTRFGPPIGGFAAVDGTSGALLTSSGVAGTVHASIPDGGGGSWIGGLFNFVQGQAHSGVAHLDASGNVTAWYPGVVDGDVDALAIDSSNPGVLYIGGFFTHVAGVTRTGAAALDVTTGGLLSWDADAGGVYAIVARNGAVYLAGEFTQAGGQPRNHLAEFDASGALLAWDPDANNRVYTMVPWVSPVTHNLTLYVGGQFTSLGGQARYAIAALDGNTGAPSAWSPNGDHAVKTIALVLNRGFVTAVYAGGTFDMIGAQSRNYLAKLDPVTGSAMSWDPSASAPVSTILMSGSQLLAGGEFTHVGNADRNYLAAVDTSTGSAGSWDPNPMGPVRTLSFGEGGVAVGGDLASFGGVLRSNIAALNITTGQPTSWNPGTDNDVNALLAAGDTLYVGGSFGSIGGQTRHAAGALTSGGALTAWDPNVTGIVHALVRSGPVVYVGGGFGDVGGQPAGSLAEVDAATGAVTGSLPSVSGAVYALSCVHDPFNGDILYIGGQFGTVGGDSHLAAAKIYVSADFVDHLWNPDFLALPAVYAISADTGSVLLGGDFQDPGITTLHYGIVEVSTTDGNATGWDVSTNGGVVKAMTQAGRTVFVTGAFTQLNQGTGALVALNPSTRTLLPWSPNLDLTGFALCWTGDRLVVGGNFTSAGDQPHPRLAAFLGGTTAVGDPHPTPGSGVRLSENPCRGPLWIGFDVPRAARVEVAIYDVAGRRVRGLLDRALPAGEQRLRWDGADDAGRPTGAGVYWVRLREGQKDESAEFVRLR